MAWLARFTQKKQDDQAAEVLRGFLKPHRAPGSAAALGLLARIESSRGELETALPHFHEAISLHAADGNLSDAADDSFALAFALNQRSHHYEDARRVLDQAAQYVGDYPDGAARLPYYRGQLAMELGDLRSALHLFNESERRARRLGLERLIYNSQNASAGQLMLVGRVQEALVILRQIDSQGIAKADVSPCESVDVAANLGYAFVLAAELGQIRVSSAHALSDATETLERALRLADDECPDPFRRSTILTFLSLTAVEQGRLDEAQTRLTEAKASVRSPRGTDALLLLETEARLEAARGNIARAMKLFDKEWELASAFDMPQGQWEAAIGRAKCLEQSGNYTQALEAFSLAARVVERSSLLIPLGEGRTSFLGDRDIGTVGHIELLFKMGRSAEALSVARAARSRVIVSVQNALRLQHLSSQDRERWQQAVQRYRTTKEAIVAEAVDDWKLPENELRARRGNRQQRLDDLHRLLDESVLASRPRETDSRGTLSYRVPSEGELLLAYYPVRDAWIGFAADASGVDHFRVPEFPWDSPPSHLSNLLLSPAGKKIQKAKRITFLPSARFNQIDFHALPWNGAPLVAFADVQYALDLDSRIVERREDSARIAAVVADPTEDLLAAQAEGSAVAQMLSRGPDSWTVHLLEGHQANLASVLHELDSAQLFHYAGHGIFSGAEGWDSSLLLAGQGRLGLGDIITSERVPRHVVLSGCETAKSASEHQAESFGLAHAFLLAGAESVVATSRKIPDALASKIARALYEEGQPYWTANHSAGALRVAQLAVRLANPELDWAAFRAFRP